MKEKMLHLQEFYKSGLRVTKGWKPWDLKYLTFSSSSQNSMSTQHVGYKSFLHWMSMKSSSSETWKEHLEVHTMVKKSVYRPHISASKHLFLFSFQFPPHGYFLARVRGGPRYQMGQIFGKFPRGGGVIFNPKIYIADFGNLKRAFLSMKLIQKSNFRIQGMFFFKHDIEKIKKRTLWRRHFWVPPFRTFPKIHKVAVAQGFTIHIHPLHCDKKDHFHLFLTKQPQTW